MRLRPLLTLIIMLIPSLTSYAVQGGLQAITIVRAEQKTRDRVIYYVVNTPLYREDPYFEVEVTVDRTTLVAEYEPRDAWEMLPVAWTPGAIVQGRIVGHSLFLKRPNGSELRFIIVKRTAPVRKAK